MIIKRDELIHENYFLDEKLTIEGDYQMVEKRWLEAYPDQVPAEIDFEKITIPQMLDRTSKKFPDKVALSYEGVDITFKQFNNLVNRFARALISIGILRGQKVAILMPNIPQTPIACQGILRIGAITVMNNPLYTLTELEAQLKDVGISVLITTDDYFDKALKLRNRLNIQTIIVSHINDDVLAQKKIEKQGHDFGPDTYHFMDLICKSSSEPMSNNAVWEDIATILFTGGTTGISKGVMLTHSNLSSNVQQYSAWLYDTVDGEETWPIMYPMFHSAGYTMFNKSIHTGWRTVLVSQPTPDILIKLIKDNRPTLFPGVATIFVGLLNTEAFHRLDLSSIKAFLTGGGPLSIETLRELKALRDVPMINVYGMTETSPVATAIPWNGAEKPASVGIPYPNTDLKIVDWVDSEKQLPVGESGEIMIKGPQVMKGYLNRPEETAKVMVDGWIHTGDIGFIDDDGYLTIVDRKKDVIVSSGFNVYPKEIDELLFAHPKILEACTIGVPDDYRGETVKSYIVLKENQTIEEEELTQYCRESLAPYKVPKLYEFIDALPKSAIGKILRKDLRARDESEYEHLAGEQSL